MIPFYKIVSNYLLIKDYLLTKKDLLNNYIFKKDLFNYYIFWSCVTNFFISIESVLGTHSMLSVVSKAKTETIISMNYIGKDILGQIGGMMIIYNIGQYLDKNPKDYIVKNMFIEQTSIFIECLIPFLPRILFIPIATVANIGKTVTFTGFGGINAKVIQKYAINDNIGELYSKICIINTIASSLGMCVGLILISIIKCPYYRILLIPMLGFLRYKSYNRSITDIL